MELANENEATVQAVKHYLRQTLCLLVTLSDQDQQEKLLNTRLAPDMFTTGFNFAVAIQFAARALCPPAGMSLPNIPNKLTCDTLIAFQNEVETLINPIGTDAFLETVTHVAGEAELTQNTPDYVARFALPNMIFHMSLAYATLRQNGVALGKADFDGLHTYSNL